MPMNVDQAESAWLTGDTEWMNFLAEFDIQFFAPVEERNMKMAWATMTEQEKATLKQIAPDAFAEVEKHMERIMEK